MTWLKDKNGDWDNDRIALQAKLSEFSGYSYEDERYKAMEKLFESNPIVLDFCQWLLRDGYDLWDRVSKELIIEWRRKCS